MYVFFNSIIIIKKNIKEQKKSLEKMYFTHLSKSNIMKDDMNFSQNIFIYIYILPQKHVQFFLFKNETNTFLVIFPKNNSMKCA